MIRNRNPYIMNRQPEKLQIQETTQANINEDEFKSALLDSMKALSKNLDDIRQSIKDMQERLEYTDSRQRKLENDLDRFNAKTKASDLELINVRNDLETLRRGTNHSYQAYPGMDRPVMPGTGFASVTPNYLRNPHQK